jgi:hypothetical protein
LGVSETESEITGTGNDGVSVRDMQQISYRTQEQQIKNINSNDSNKNQNMERLEEGLS